MSNEQVRRVLNLEKRYQPYPIFHTMLTSGQVSVNKLARVASIITPENESALAHQVKVLSSRALEVFVRDEKCAQKEIQNEVQNGPQNAQIRLLIGSLNGQSEPQGEQENVPPDGLCKAKNGEKSVHVHDLKTEAQNVPVGIDGSASTGTNGMLQLSQEVQVKLLELQNKGIDINALILEFLHKREKEIVKEKNEIAAVLAANHPADEEDRSLKQSVSPYIPVKVRAILKKEFGIKCSIQNCQRDSERIHHTQRFAMSKNHNPYFLAPLCKEHHDIAHSIDVKWGGMKVKGP